MDNPKQRVLEELNELKERLIKLYKFLGSKDSYEIDPEQRNLLLLQATYMANYKEILEKRLSIWRDDERK